MKSCTVSGQGNDAQAHDEVAALTLGHLPRHPQGLHCFNIDGRPLSDIETLGGAVTASKTDPGPGAQLGRQTQHPVSELPLDEGDKNHCLWQTSVSADAGGKDFCLSASESISNLVCFEQLVE